MTSPEQPFISGKATSEMYAHARAEMMLFKSNIKPNVMYKVFPSVDALNNALGSVGKHLVTIAYALGEIKNGKYVFGVDPTESIVGVRMTAEGDNVFIRTDERISSIGYINSLKVSYFNSETRLLYYSGNTAGSHDFIGHEWSGYEPAQKNLIRAVVGIIESVIEVLPEQTRVPDIFYAE